MRKLLLIFILFIAALWGLGQVHLPVLLVGIALMMALMTAGHILATPENY
jgi:hypothetical protein